jgi:hypothetical protein
MKSDRKVWEAEFEDRKKKYEEEKKVQEAESKK